MGIGKFIKHLEEFRGKIVNLKRDQNRLFT